MLRNLEKPCEQVRDQGTSPAETETVQDVQKGCEHYVLQPSGCEVGFSRYPLLSRRRFLQTCGLVLCSASLPLEVQAADVQVALPIPPLLESTRGQPLFLTLQQAHWEFIQDKRSPAWGINGRYLGPTVRVTNGSNVKLIYRNQLNEPVAMTVSGLQVPGVLAGGPARSMPPGGEWSPVLPISQEATTCWYHSSTPGRMASQVYQGLAGMWLVESAQSRQLPLPNTYGLDDIPLIIQDKRLSRIGIMEYQAPEHGGFMGNHLLVNGVENPLMLVPRGWVRLRLLNASNARRYQLQLSDNRAWYLIANDLGLLPMPIPVQQLSLAPGERREVLIDMTQGSEVTLSAGEQARFLERLRGLFEPSETLLSSTIVTLRPEGLQPLLANALPTRLLAQWPAKGEAVRSREFLLGDTMPGINGLLWDLSRIDVQAQQGSWERWVLRADLPQGFHIQGVSFLISKINGVPPLAEDQGWKDTVWVDGQVELYVYFNQTSSAQYPFQFYSQTLELADRGSAGQLVVAQKADLR